MTPDTPRFLAHGWILRAYLCTGLLKFLKDRYGAAKQHQDGDMQAERSGEDMLWNSVNHTLLTEEDFRILIEDYDVHPWVFKQKEVSRMHRPTALRLSRCTIIDSCIYMRTWSQSPLAACLSTVHIACLPTCFNARDFGCRETWW